MFWQRRNLKAARVGSWKWVDMGNDSQGLFDLASDPGERKNLATEKPDILNRLRKQFADWRKEMDQAEPRGPFRNF